MRKAIALLTFVLAAPPSASGQQAEPKATGTVWLDAFGGKDGAVIYPQYNWSLATSAGTFAGYGFLESAPRELLFNNNLVGYTPKGMPWFTAHGEIGDVPGRAKGFVQLGPRANLQKIIPGSGKIINFAFIAYLPAFEGIRTKNVLIAGATQQFPVFGKGFTAHVEAFNRTFSNFSYGEIWTVGHVRGWKHVDPVIHVIRDSSRNPTYTVTAGFRFTLK